ncbi:uncharacterized protein LOC122053224 [Zingiber officinale]|uniref:Uncharacterized protein n=1 Tax=Zingiber officinale TaxID=94328 RepID=A0A8J5LBZ4_ZINOF|nr:uncharacterized protein LOC122053224 [Zingiber officinale]KAG6522822.1 hypothetical protein ZIOFF_019977 [Zingiber officinale]
MEGAASPAVALSLPRAQPSSCPLGTRWPVSLTSLTKGIWPSPLFRRRCASVVRGEGGAAAGKTVLRTCKNCKRQFDPALNYSSACRFHTAHFGGETKRKFESVYTGGTMDTPDSGKVFQYWHCCGSEDPFDAGCTAAPHCSYDD